MKRICLLSSLFLCALNAGYGQAGNLDSSFGINGIVKTDAGAQAPYSFITPVIKILLAKDGSLFNVISTTFGRTAISKRHADGSVDLTYKNKGFSDYAVISGNDAVMQPDGKIIVVGYTKVPGPDFKIARYNTDGSLDKTFGSDGYKSTVFTSNSLANSVALQSDGKIVVGGILGDFNGGDFAIVRYNPSGTLDKSFAVSGKQTTSFGPPSSTLKSLVIQTDGKIVAAGFTSMDAGDSHIFALARYNSNGSLDNSFSNDGKQTTRLGGGNYATTAALQADGKIVVAGFVFIEENERFEGCVARYKTNGSLDSTFSGDGSVITDYGAHYDISQTIALQSDGKIVMAHAISTENGQDFAVSRYTVSGSLDNTFSGNGIQVTDFNHGHDVTRAVAIQKDGKILVGGETSGAGEEDPGLCRYKTDGTPDNTFGTNGKLTYSFRHGYTGFNATAVQKDGKVVSAGFTWNGDNYDFAVARYNINGALDHSFSGDGITTISFGPGNDFANAVAIQNDGKIVLAGSHSDGEVQAFAVARFNTDGTPDNTFDGDGQKTIVFGPDFDNYATSLAIQKNGTIIAGGTYNEKSALIRLNPSGTLDKTFSDNGKQLTDFPGSPYSVINSIALQSNGKIITAGNTLTGGKFTLGRFNTDGTLDESFGDHGKDTGSFNSGAAVAIQSDDKIILAGAKVSRFTKDGTLDLTFNGTGSVMVNSSTNAVAIDHNGKIFLGGSWASHSSVSAINSNGTPDQSFGDNGIKIVPVGISGSDNTLGSDVINGIAIFNDKLYASGLAADPGTVGTVFKFLLGSSSIQPAIALNKINTLAAPGINNMALALRVFPNPVHDILNIYTNGLQENKQQTISIISTSGVIIQTRQTGVSSRAIPLDVSSLARGTYIIKMVSGEKIIYQHFVKM